MTSVKQGHEEHGFKSLVRLWNGTQILSNTFTNQNCPVVLFTCKVVAEL